MRATIYIAETSGYFKIGVTERSFRDRIAEINTLSPLPVNNVLYFKVENKKMGFDLEARLHNAMKKFHSHNEWFFKFNNWKKFLITQVNEICELPEIKEENYDVIKVFDASHYFSKKINNALCKKDISSIVQLKHELELSSTDLVFYEIPKRVMLANINSIIKTNMGVAV